MRTQTLIAITLLSINLQFTIFNCKAQTYFNVDFNNDSSMWSSGAFVHPFEDSSGYLAVGNLPMGGGPVYTRFLRLNIYGDTLWTKLYGNSQYGQYPTIGNYINIGDTNFVFTGIFSPQSSDSSQTVFYKIDSAGTVLWDIKFGDAGMKTTPSDIKATSDGGYIITGWTTGWGATNTASSFLLKVDNLGNEEWHKIYGGGSFREAFSVEVTADNGFMMAGDYYPVAGTNRDINVVKTDSLGNLIWSQNYGTPEEDNPFAYITKYGTTDDYILVGAIDIVPGNILADFQGYIARISGVNGVVVWADTMGVVQNGTQDGFISNVIVLPTGDIVGIGRTHYQSSTGAVDAWIVKYNSNGNLLWQRTFNKYGGNNWNYLVDIHQTYDNGFVLCGDLTNVAIPEQNLWVLKLDSMGCEIVNCSVGVEEPPSLLGRAGVGIYPNPNNGKFTITLVENEQQVPIFIYNLSGQVVQQLNINNNAIIDMSKQPNGIYFVKVVQHNKV
ncbi:MAG: hypothetical protein COX70_04180, partial [Flavobacteriales bacterium CG_4_10_14_0_2_um_filter_32_8]